MYKNSGVNPRQPVDQDLAVSPNINALRATDSYLYKYYMLFSLKYQLVFIIFSPSQSEIQPSHKSSICTLSISLKLLHYADNVFFFQRVPITIPQMEITIPTTIYVTFGKRNVNVATSVRISDTNSV